LIVFFFQAEDGIRDFHVTGVQTCALPICVLLGICAVPVSQAAEPGAKPDLAKGEQLYVNGDMARGVIACASCHGDAGNSIIPVRSEERRVGKECRGRWSRWR